MKILIVAMSDSIHTARWIDQIGGEGWEIHLFPSIDGGAIHPRLKNVTIHKRFYRHHESKNRAVNIKGIPVVCRGLEALGKSILRRLSVGHQALYLKGVLEKVKPDVVHSLEIQRGGYLTTAAKKLCKAYFPPWVVTNWGSDIYLFGRLDAHRSRIGEVMDACDYYTCECHRDVRLAKDFGFRGTVLMVSPNGGGFDLQRIRNFQRPGRPSDRGLIMVKGYQGWSGRALVALRALKRSADILEGYEIAIYSASPEVIMSAELLSDSAGIPTMIVPKETPHDEILRLHGRARISIGLSIGDAISTSLLEAIVMGSFPIQSWTSCADEWIEDAKTGFLVPPEDPEVVEQAIRRALGDDELVNTAAELNRRTAEKRLDQNILRQKAVEMYNVISEKRGSRE